MNIKPNEWKQNEFKELKNRFKEPEQPKSQTLKVVNAFIIGILGMVCLIGLFWGKEGLANFGIGLLVFFLLLFFLIGNTLVLK